MAKRPAQGFYTWVDGKPQKTPGEFDAAELDRLGKDLVKPLIDECEKCLAEGVVSDADHVDAGVIFGRVLRPFRGGPLHYRTASASPPRPAATPGRRRRSGGVRSPDAAIARVWR